jgi:NitT/TauT family transport system substrate-binding protein
VKIESKPNEEKKVVPSFSLGYSEYPSWSVFGVAADKGLIDPAPGKMGELEKKWGVDIVLKLVDYDTCITMYGSKAVDAVCITNTDILGPSLGRKSTAIFPTSTSNGADACLAVNFKGTVGEFLKDKTVFGLEKSVSEFVFYRCLQTMGLNAEAYKFSNMDPAAASQAMQTGQAQTQAIMVWNPFVLQTLKTGKNVSRLFDSSLIPGEVIDMVVVGSDSLAQPGGENFARCLADCFYQVNKMIEADKNGEIYVALGSKFCSLNAADMKRCCVETKFFGTSTAGNQVFSDKKFPQVMQTIVEFYKTKKYLKESPVIKFGDNDAQLNFETKYMLP